MVKTHTTHITHITHITHNSHTTHTHNPNPHNTILSQHNNTASRTNGVPGSTSSNPTSDLKFGAGQTSVDDGLYDAGLASELATEIQESEGSDMEDDSDGSVIDEGRDVDNDDARVTERQDDFKELREKNGSGVVDTRISNRESSYHARRHARTVNDTDTEGNQLTYQEIMENKELEREKAELEDKVRKIEEKKVGGGRGGEDAASDDMDVTATTTASAPAASSSRWDSAGGSAPSASSSSAPKRRRRWDATPAAAGAPGSAATSKSRWDETPAPGGGAQPAAKKRSRWDATPAAVVEKAKKTAEAKAPDLLADPRSTMAEREMSYRNRPLTDAELDNLLPSEGYRVLDPPAGYKPVLRLSSNKKDMSAPTPSGASQGGFTIAPDAPAGLNREAYGITLGAVGTAGPDGIPFIKQEDYQYFGKLMDDKKEGEMSKAEVKEVRRRSRWYILCLLREGC